MCGCRASWQAGSSSTNTISAKQTSRRPPLINDIHVVCAPCTRRRARLYSRLHVDRLCSPFSPYPSRRPGLDLLARQQATITTRMCISGAALPDRQTAACSQCRRRAVESTYRYLTFFSCKCIISALVTRSSAMAEGLATRLSVNLQSMNDLEIHSRSSQLLLLNGRTTYHFLFVDCNLGLFSRHYRF